MYLMNSFSIIAFSVDRMLHHTSFLWDFDDRMMEALKVHVHIISMTQ